MFLSDGSEIYFCDNEISNNLSESVDSSSSVLLDDSSNISGGKNEENSTKEYLTILKENKEMLQSIDESLKYQSTIFYFTLILIIFYIVVKFFYRLFSWFI